MTSKKEYIAMNSAEGTAMWAKVNTQVDEYEGKETGYTINVYFDDAYTKELEKTFAKMIKEAQSGKDYLKKNGDPKEWRPVPRVPVKKDDDGNKYVVFKTRHIDSEGNRKYVKIFDKANKDLGTDITIGNGSKVVINFSPSIYYLTSENNGIKCYLNAIQVKDLKTFSGGDSGESYGFDKVLDETPSDEEEAPF